MDKNENNNDSEVFSAFLKSIWNSFDSNTKESIKNYIMDTLATKPEARGDLIRVAKQEFDFNIGHILNRNLEKYQVRKNELKTLTFQ